MPGTPEVIMDEFKAVTVDYALSIVLVGSHALGLARESSDIDLIVLTESHQNANTIRRFAEELNRDQSRPIIDCKVYTKAEFLRAKTGPENRFLWTCLTNGRVLFGEDITQDVLLNPRLVSESYWQCVQNVEDAARNLEAGIQYTGSCFFLYDAFSTTYFIGRFIFHSIGEDITKEDFIKPQLREEFSRVRKQYYWISRRAETKDAQNKLRIALSADRKFSKDDYNRLHTRAQDSLTGLLDMYRKIKGWSESIVS